MEDLKKLREANKKNELLNIIKHDQLLQINEKRAQGIKDELTDPKATEDVFEDGY